MKLFTYAAATVLAFACLFSCVKSEKRRVLVFSKTSGYRHESIGTGKIALMELGNKHGFEVDTTEDASVFTEDNLKRYGAVVFLNTTQNVLDPYQQSEFKRFIEAGGGFVGIHSATDTEYDWPWYGKLVGAYFKNHPEIQEAKLKKVRAFGPNTLPDTWTHTDEWYNFKQISDKINVIYEIDETSYKGGENGANHPVAWYQEYEGGRSFYTALGHTHEAYKDPQFLEHLLQGIQYALGEDVKVDYKKATSQKVPEENRFSKNVLGFNFDEPTEMSILPDGRVMFIERKGGVKLYDPKAEAVKEINKFNVWHGEEDGMIGLTIDPDFKNNNWVYIFYSHPDRSANVLSRFTFNGEQIDMSSEKLMLEVPTQRAECCHTGGSLAFGPDGNLYISTGDNTNPFESDGYSPSDERPGRSDFDAQKSSSNTNDLRGKILRIRPQPDGTYTIPEGNLFPKGEPNTRPEIYVMGCRNPYRISVDKRTGYLYWGDVGPDAQRNDSLRGPRGHDEINQARKAGFYGWPYFVGDNFAYHRIDFNTKESIRTWDPETPLNESPNNTGKKELPPAQRAFIWYPYAKSDEFPMLREGARNAMAGPFYYSEDYKGIETAFPSYFDGKLLAYDWMRNWMFMVSMDNDGNIKDIEPFMPGTEFSNIIDMEYGPDGRLYMLEYGLQWFKQNLDARLVRIDYNAGNRPPVARLAANTTAGSLPLTVNFTADGTVDHDGDDLQYNLQVGEKSYSSNDGNFTVEFTTAGVYEPVLRVEDKEGASSTAKLKIVAGNEPPVVEASLTSGNHMFFFPGKPVTYEVTVSDKEDGNSTDGGISGQSVIVTFDHLIGLDMTQIAQGHQKAPVELPGKALIESSDCKSCHQIDKASAGPSYVEVATRYAGKSDAVDYLAGKVIKGGGGVWGERVMAAHPNISVDDAKKMITYIMSLSGKQSAKLPLKGTVTPGNKQEGVYILKATYTDRAIGDLPAQSATESIILRAPVLMTDHVSSAFKATRQERDGNVFLTRITDGGHAMFKNIDMTYIKKLQPIAFTYGSDLVGGTIEVRLDGKEGKLLGTMEVPPAEPAAGRRRPPVITTGSIELEPVEGRHDLWLVFKNETAGDRFLFNFSRVLLSP